MKRIAVVTGVVAVLLLIDGIYLQLSHNEVGGDSGILFGNPNLFLSAGTVVLISGALMLAGTGIMWVVAVRRQGRLRADRSQVSHPSHPSAGEAQATVSAAQAQTGKEPDHQRQP
jgi:hypothetical protein